LACYPPAVLGKKGKKKDWHEARGGKGKKDPSTWGKGGGGIGKKREYYYAEKGGGTISVRGKSPLSRSPSLQKGIRTGTRGKGKKKGKVFLRQRGKRKKKGPSLCDF